MRSLLLFLSALALVAPAFAQLSPGQQPNGLHPDEHGPDTPPPRRKRIVSPAPPATYRQPAAHRWHSTAGHIRACRRRYKTYNPRTDRYVPRPGLRRRCVL